MTQIDLLQALMVERYQPRHLAPSNDEMPPVLTFEELVASLRAEARRDAPAAYAPLPRERRKRDEADADRFIAEHGIADLVERRRRAREERRIAEQRARRAEQARRRKEQQQASDLKVEKVSEALSSGMSLREALITAQRGTANG